MLGACRELVPVWMGQAQESSDLMMMARSRIPVTARTHSSAVRLYRVASCLGASVQIRLPVISHITSQATTLEAD